MFCEGEVPTSEGSGERESIRFEQCTYRAVSFNDLRICLGISRVESVVQNQHKHTDTHQSAN